LARPCVGDFSGTESRMSTARSSVIRPVPERRMSKREAFSDDG
jgi:hypothetical protein